MAKLAVLLRGAAVSFVDMVHPAVLAVEAMGVVSIIIIFYFFAALIVVKYPKLRVSLPEPASIPPPPNWVGTLADKLTARRKQEEEGVEPNCDLCEKLRPT
eukprot:2956424-Rhodomonas_salina.1